MDVPSQSVLLGAIYTLTPTHCGTGQAIGAIDLPIARESTTGVPVLPASMLKGVARELAELQAGKGSALVKTLFGPDTGDEQLVAGSLVFTEGRLLALPARSLQRPYLYATCPLWLERLDRDLRAFGLPGLMGEQALPQPQPDQVLVADAKLAGQTLVVEDLVYESAQVGALSQLESIAKWMARLLPEQEQATRQRLKDNLVVLPDADASYLCQSAVPVQARIQLGEGKTTSRYVREDGTVDEGNLWYEETLSADALFTFFVAWRRDAKSVGGAGQKPPKEVVGLSSFLDIAAAQRHVQIGGNETVGQGWCWWKFQDADAKEDE